MLILFRFFEQKILISFFKTRSISIQSFFSNIEIPLWPIRYGYDNFSTSSTGFPDYTVTPVCFTFRDHILCHRLRAVQNLIFDDNLDFLCIY